MTKDEDGSEEDMALRSLRRRLRGLVGLEWLQTSLALAGLVAIALRAIVLAEEPPVVLAISAVVVLSLAMLALGIRLRAGQELVRRELLARELRRAPEARGPVADHPYRHDAKSIACRCLDSIGQRP